MNHQNGQSRADRGSFEKDKAIIKKIKNRINRE